MKSSNKPKNSTDKSYTRAVRGAKTGRYIVVLNDTIHSFEKGNNQKDSPRTLSILETRANLLRSI
jgi:hypothetical protein